MTATEARERAGVIWGVERIERVEVYDDDSGAEIELKPRGTARSTYHRIDANGHATCHAHCIVLEDAR